MNWDQATASVLDITKGVFGRDVTYTPAAGSPSTIQGIFASEHIEVDMGDGVPASRMAPTLGIKLADLAADPALGDQVTISSTTYSIIDCQKDGQGGAKLILQEV